MNLPKKKRQKVVKLRELATDEIVQMLQENGHRMKNVFLAYELDGQLQFDRTALDSRGCMIGLLEYAKFEILRG